MARVFLTFADAALRPSAQRITRQAAEMGIYDRIVRCSARDLDRGFRQRFAGVLNPATRGFGFFCWKPQLIRQQLEALSPNDLLHYCDVGCHLNPHGRKRMTEYFAMVSDHRSGVLAFQAKPLPDSFGAFAGLTPFQTWTNAAWCKGDTFRHFGLASDQAFLEGPQSLATTVVFRKCKAAERLVSAWCEAFLEDFTLIDDTPSRSPNHRSFQEHRWDQSLFSCLAHKERIVTLSNGEIEFARSPEGRGDWQSMAAFPIHARRDKQTTFLSRVRASLRYRLRRSIAWPRGAQSP